VKKPRRFRKLRIAVATILQAGITAGTLATLLLQRVVAEIEDEEREETRR
jgi:xanthine/uracil permease